MACGQDYISHGEKHINGSSGYIHYQDYAEWLRKIEPEKCKEALQEDTPGTTYFTVRKEGNKIIGSIQLCNHLTEELKQDGENIGYGICRPERDKGYGTQQLALVLIQVQALQIQKVMI